MTETTDLQSSSPTTSGVLPDHDPSALEYEKHSSEDQSAKLVILTVNDVYDMVPNEHGHGGIAEFATLLEQQKAALQDDVTLLVTVNGDFLSGSEMAERFKGAHMIELMNHLNIGYVVLGNHEFDFGAEELKLRMRESTAKWFGSNVRDSASGKLFQGVVDTEIIPLKDGLKLGLFGVCTEETPTLSFPGASVQFDDVFLTSRRCVNQLQAQGADFIVALTHLSVSQDKKLARQVPGIDLILGGHDHEPFTMYEGKTLIHKSGQNALWLARLEFDIKRSCKDSAQGVNILPQWSMLANANVPPQQACQQILYKYMEQMAIEDANARNDQVLATLLAPLSTKTALLRAGECNGGNLVADALRAELTADIGFINGGFIRGDREYPAKSSITVGILKHEMPFPRPAVLVRITGRNLRDAFVQHLYKYPEQSGSHPHVSGLKITIDVNVTPPCVTEMLHDNGESVDLEKEFLVATSKFVAGGGDGCSAWFKGEIIREASQVPDIVAEFLMKKRLLDYKKSEGRITLIK
ncbi:calcineurinlike phosphoesterase [Plasmopara halstedii]|uniref:Calcineurinlike phosphoesterase n=1 Tax=Plasmopara halstedii TaxID=4781 RepID=A0A0P1AQE8_PLAHL|nr:calcineurinlike phosphoesterase [Plasmopara halstedii]CEG43702.1 calcineurinlike phosphoesterase [Plasmopara halstedii]|eukprot:XP_024580071.1 calcineurinlike phosphoesterase [Plasmopara halstedii]